MGLTFQQKFYNLPEEVFLATTSEGIPVGIIEIPESKEEAMDLKAALSIRERVFLERINFDDLVINGYRLVERVKE